MPVYLYILIALAWVAGGIVGFLLSLLLILTLLYFVWFVRPASRKPEDPSLLCDYAHRGLHSGSVPENSLAAFERACEKGFGIELDIQLSSDGEVMVFHDHTLSRMTGVDKKLCELTASELSALRLSGSDERIPTLKEVLALVGGRVPILVELKGESFDTSLCEKAAEILKDYKGRYCIESFNPLLVRGMRKYFPHAFCGLLYTNAVRDKKKASVINIAVTLMALNFLCKPDFIAFNEVDRDSFFVRLTTKMYKATKFVWTVRGREAFDAAHKKGECVIFENIEV